MAIGSITLTSLITRESASFEFAVVHLGETELTGGVRPTTTAEDYAAMKQKLSEGLRSEGVASVIRVLDEHFAEPLLSIRALFRDEQRRILNFLCNNTLREAEGAFRQLHERYDPLMRFHSALGIPLPKVLRTAAEFDVNMQLRRMLEDAEPPLADIEVLLRESRNEQVTLDEVTLLTLRRAVERAATAFGANPEDLEKLERWEAIVALIRESRVEVDLRKPQNEYYRMRKAVRPMIAASAGNGAPWAGRWLQHFDALGEKLSISPEPQG
jgi:hypothetical protein